MEFKTSKNPDCIVYEQYTGACYLSTIDEINKIQNEINNKLASSKHFSIKEVYGILTEDWPEDKKEKFWQRYYDLAGWMTEVHHDKYYRFIQRKSLNKDGDIVIHLDLTPDWEKNEELE